MRGAMPLHNPGHPPTYRELRLAGTNPPAHALTQGEQIVPFDGGARRMIDTIAEVQAAMHDGRRDAALRRIDDALDAQMWIRTAHPSGRGVNYALMPDHASRLTGARLILAYRYGTPVAMSEVRLHRAPTDEPERMSPAEQLRELRAAGVDLEKVVKTWMRGLEDVTPQPGRPGRPTKEQKNAENDETAPLIDAFVDV